MSNRRALSNAVKESKQPKQLSKPKDIDYNSQMGYRDDSPFRNKSSIDINTPTGSIDMSNTGIPLMANGKYLPPYSGTHQFDTNVVRETPFAEGGMVEATVDENGVPRCPDGYDYNSSTGYCEKPGDKCPKGYEKDPETGKCRVMLKACPSSKSTDKKYKYTDCLPERAIPKFDNLELELEKPGLEDYDFPKGEYYPDKKKYLDWQLNQRYDTQPLVKVREKNIIRKENPLLRFVTGYDRAKDDAKLYKEHKEWGDRFKKELGKLDSNPEDIKFPSFRGIPAASWEDLRNRKQYKKNYKDYVKNELPLLIERNKQAKADYENELLELNLQKQVEEDKRNAVGIDPNTLTEWKKGGGLKSKKYSKSLQATNKFFREHSFFEKPKKLSKKRIYDPNAKYYQDGGLTVGTSTSYPSGVGVGALANYVPSQMANLKLANSFKFKDVKTPLEVSVGTPIGGAKSRSNTYQGFEHPDEHESSIGDAFLPEDAIQTNKANFSNWQSSNKGAPIDVRVKQSFFGVPQDKNNPLRGFASVQGGYHPQTGFNAGVEGGVNLVLSRNGQANRYFSNRGLIPKQTVFMPQLTMGYGVRQKQAGWKENTLNEYENLLNQDAQNNTTGSIDYLNKEVKKGNLSGGHGNVAFRPQLTVESRPTRSPLTLHGTVGANVNLAGGNRAFGPEKSGVKAKTNVYGEVGARYPVDKLFDKKSKAKSKIQEVQDREQEYERERPIKPVEQKEPEEQTEWIGEHPRWLRDGGSTDNYVEIDIPKDQIQKYVDGGYIVEDYDPSIPELNTYAEGGAQDCPQGTYWNGTKCTKLVTLKSDKKYIDGVANWAMHVSDPNMITSTYNDNIKDRLYSGKWGFDPESGALVRLDKIQPQSVTKLDDKTKASREKEKLTEQNYRAEEENKKAYEQSIKSAGFDPTTFGKAKGVNTITGEPIYASSKEEAERINQEAINQFAIEGHAAVVNNPVFQAASYFTPWGMAIGAMRGAARLAPDTYDFAKDPSWSGAGQLGIDLAEISPFTKPIANTVKSAVQNTYKINPWAFKPDQSKFYRQIGKTGLADALSSNVIKSADQTTFPRPYFVKGKDFKALEQTGSGAHGRPSVMFETSGVTNEGLPFVYPANASADYTPWIADMAEVPLTEGRLLQKDWLQGYKKVPKQLPGSPNASISDRLKQFFDRPPGPLMLGMPTGSSGNMVKKNISYYEQLLNTYDSKVMSATNKKFYKDLIGTAKKQDGMLTEAQLRELDRLKTGNFDFGKRGFNKESLTQVEPKAPIETPKSEFKSEIDWGKWNKEIPKNAPLMQEYNTIEETAKANNTWMKNPDGSKFIGTPEQFVQQNSENFKKAFSNPVLDDAGNVQYNYHGSPNKFEVFDKTKFNKGLFGKGIYTTTNKDIVLKGYAKPRGVKSDNVVLGQDGHLYELYLNSKNPKVFNTMDDFLEYTDYSDITDFGKTMDDYLTLPELKEKYKETLKNYSFKNEEEVESFIANAFGRKNQMKSRAKLVMPDVDFIRFNDIDLKPQVTPFNASYPKSAIGNNGMFDMSNPNIYKVIIPTVGVTGLTGLMLANPSEESNNLPQQKKGGPVDDYIEMDIPKSKVQWYIDNGYDVEVLE